ncbi:MAG TPA: SDR family NAD(P)-dependent oxidoreductase, partial [Schlesneria sp.]
MFQYQGKTALITGASSGIGAAFVHALAMRGMSVILVARSEEAMNSLAAEVKQKHQVQAHVITADLSQIDAAAKIGQIVAERGLTVDLLI